MAEVGILKPTDRVELIRGEIVEMSPVGRRHKAFVDNLNQLLTVRIAGRAIVSVQNPVVLADDTEPEPDFKILRRRSLPYKELEAHGEDALLIIEVAENSLSYDRSTKLRLYAEAGIPEYWIVNPLDETSGVLVLRDGAYVERGPFARGMRATSALFPDVSVEVDAVFDAYYPADGDRE